MIRVFFILFFTIVSEGRAFGQEAGIGLEYPAIVKKHIDSLEKLLENAE